MGLRIGTNVAALAAQRNLAAASAKLGKNYLRLSTGRRIASASDDAAGLGISARLQAQVRGLNQAVRNASDGLGLVTTAESALEETQSTLIRMRELAVQAQNGTLSSSDQTNLQSEFSQLQSQLDQIADGTEFNNIALLNATSTLTLQVGADTGATNQLTFATAAVTTSDLTLETSDASIGTAAAASTAVGLIDTALDVVTTSRGTFGAVQNRLEVAIASLQKRSENLQAANSRILDVDIAYETAELTKNSILQQSALSVLAQANTAPTAALALLQF